MQVGISELVKSPTTPDGEAVAYKPVAIPLQSANADVPIGQAALALGEDQGMVAKIVGLGVSVARTCGGVVPDLDRAGRSANRANIAAQRPITVADERI